MKHVLLQASSMKTTVVVLLTPNEASLVVKELDEWGALHRLENVNEIFSVRSFKNVTDAKQHATKNNIIVEDDIVFCTAY